MIIFKKKNPKELQDAPKRIKKRVAIYRDLKTGNTIVKSMAKDQDGIYFEIGEQFFLTKLYDPESLIESVMKAMSNFHVFHRERGDHSFYPKHWTATLKKYYYVAISEVSDEMIEVRSFKRGHLGGKSGYLGVEDPVIEVPIARIQTELPEAVEKAFEICKMRDEW